MLQLQFVVNAAPESVKVCMMDTDLFPLWRQPRDENQTHPGINIELQQYISYQLGHSIVWVRAPFPRCLVLLKQNEVDLLNVASYSPEREQYGLYPKINGAIDIEKRLKSDAYHAYTLQHSHVVWDGESFSHIQDKPIAIEIGASIRKFLNEKTIPVYEVSRVDQAFGMLELGRVSAVVTNKFNGLSFISTDVKELPVPITTKPYYIMISEKFHRDYPEYAEQIWEHSKDAREALYHGLLKKYGQFEDWPP